MEEACSYYDKNNGYDDSGDGSFMRPARHRRSEVFLSMRLQDPELGIWGS